MISPTLRAAAMVLLSMASAPADAGGVVAGKVVRILDGDTVEILVDRRPIRKPAGRCGARRRCS